MPLVYADLVHTSMNQYSCIVYCGVCFAHRNKLNRVECSGAPSLQAKWRALNTYWLKCATIISPAAARRNFIPCPQFINSCVLYEIEQTNWQTVIATLTESSIPSDVLQLELISDNSCPTLHKKWKCLTTISMQLKSYAPVHTAKIKHEMLQLCQAVSEEWTKRGS